MSCTRDQITIEVSHEGLLVEINAGEKATLFESGSSNLSPKLIEALKALAAEYQKVSNKLIIEGHTDAVPFSSDGMSNWELSTQRANEARRVLEGAGLAEDKVLMVRGFADRRPRFDDPLDSRNRRISMLLVSDQGMDIALGKLSFYGIEDKETAPATPDAQPQKFRVSLYATDKEGDE